MEQIIERLREEKKQDTENYYAQGKEDGLEWAKAASFSELQYALNWGSTKSIMAREHLIDWDPRQDEILGDYFSDVFEDDENMGFEEGSGSGMRGGIPNLYFGEWEKGWSEAVREFWDEIKNKI